MGIPFTVTMGFLFTVTMGKLFTMTLGIQLTISTPEPASGARTANTRSSARPGGAIDGSSKQNKEAGKPASFFFSCPFS